VTTINQLSAITEFAEADKLPVWQTANSDARSGTVGLLTEYVSGVLSDEALTPQARVFVGTGATAPALTITSGEMFNNGTSDVPLVPLEGLTNIKDSLGVVHLAIWPDLDGDGDYDADFWFKSNGYIAATASMHFRFGDNDQLNGAGFSERGRIRMGCTGNAAGAGTTNVNFLQSGVNFSGTTFNDFAIGAYGSSSWWTYWDYETGNVGVGTSTPAARLHVQNSTSTIGLFENTATAIARFGLAPTFRVEPWSSSCTHLTAPRHWLTSARNSAATWSAAASCSRSWVISASSPTGGRRILAVCCRNSADRRPPSAQALADSSGVSRRGLNSLIPHPPSGLAAKAQKSARPSLAATCGQQSTSGSRASRSPVDGLAVRQRRLANGGRRRCALPHTTCSHSLLDTPIGTAAALAPAVQPEQDVRSASAPSRAGTSLATLRSPN